MRSLLRRVPGVIPANRAVRRFWHVRCWRWSESRRHVLRSLRKGGVGVEVGVWEGQFSELLLRAVKPARLHLVDPWSFQPDFGDSMFGGAAARSQEDMDDIFRGVEERFRGAPVVLHRTTSVAAAASFPHESVDWVYLDGNHAYEHVSQDLRAWWPAIRSGGLLAGDDYSTFGWWGDGVIRAVADFIDEFPCEVVDLGRAYQFVLQKP